MGWLKVGRREIDYCVSRIEALSKPMYTDLAAEQCLESILPVVLKLKEGHHLAAHVRQMLNERTPQRAITLLQNTSRKRDISVSFPRSRF